MQQQQETTITTMPHWSLYHEKESCSWHFETLCPKQSLVRPLFWVTFLCCLCPREKRVLLKRTNAGNRMDWLLRCVCSPSYARSDLANSRCYSPIMPWWRLQACRGKPPYNKQLITLERSVFGDTSTLPYWPHYRSVNAAWSRFEIFT